MKKDKKLFLVVGIIVVVIALVISLVFTFSSKSAKTYDEQMVTAQSFILKKDYKKAEASYLAAIKVKPKKAEPYLKLADFYVYNDETDKAVSILDQGIKKVEEHDNKKLADKKIQIINGESVRGNGSHNVIYGEDMYMITRYSTDHKICTKIIKIDTNGNEKVLYKGKKEQKDGNISIVNGHLYYVSLNEIVSLDLNGKKQKHYNPKKLWDLDSKIGGYYLLNIENNKLTINIYNKDTTDGIIFAIDTLTQKEEVVKKHAISSPTLTDELYYFDTVKSTNDEVVIGCYNLSTNKDKKIATIDGKMLSEVSEGDSRSYGYIEKLNDSITFACWSGIKQKKSVFDIGHMNVDGTNVKIDFSKENGDDYLYYMFIDKNGHVEIGNQKDSEEPHVFGKLNMINSWGYGATAGKYVWVIKKFDNVDTIKEQYKSVYINRETGEEIFSFNNHDAAHLDDTYLVLLNIEYDGKYLYYTMYKNDTLYYQYDTVNKTTKLIYTNHY